MKFSDEQNAIINAKLDNNLVSASAGSGKTTVLTARIGDEVMSGALSVDAMLVVTFTEDAAAHMAEKIEEKLRSLRNEAVANGDTDLASRLSSQIDLLPNAYIQTMHGFCSRVIKEKGYLLSDGPMAEFTDPSCRIITESEQGVLLQSAVDYAIRDLYAECKTEEDPFIRFTRRFGDGRSDMTLVNIVTDTYKTLRSLPDYLDKCEEFVKERKDRDAKGLVMYFEGDNDIPGRIVKYLTDIKKILVSSDFASMLESHDTYRIVEEYTNEEFISEVSGRIDQVVEDYKTHSGADFFGYLKPVKELSLLNFKGLFRNADLKGDDSPLYALISLRHFIDPGKWADTKYDNPLDLPEEYGNLMGFDLETILANQKAGTEASECFVELLKRTDKFYAELKNGMHGMDYSDLEHTAYEILKTDEASEFYRAKFTEIFVDEYQDNTRLQDKIIETFERKEGNVFRVGDIKQSIYKFRFADPKIFGSRMDAYSSDPSLGKVHYLKENHRSTCEILAFANYVFGQTMSREASEIEYDDTQRLSKAVESKHGSIPRIVVADKGLPKNEDGDRTEPDTKAVYAAVESEVRRYLEECTRVDGSKTEFKDICILTASNNQAENIARYLNGCTLKDGRKIEASGRFTTDVFEDRDIHRLINFLICLGNEYRDEYLAGVMLSNYKFSNFTVEELASIQAFIHELEGPSLDKEPLMLRLRVYIDKCDSELASRVKGFVDVFDRIRMSSMVTDIDDIIELIYRETGIKATLEAREGDSSKFDVFKDWLSESFKRRGSDVSGISSELEQMKIQIKKADIEIVDANKNKITTMTVHKSKGLEYPFVILVATGGQDERKDNLSSIMFDRDDGFITEDYDFDNITRSHSFEQYIYKMKMRLASNSETVRLLYVALTRAEESLSVITCCDFTDDGKSSAIRKAFTQAVDYEDRAFDKRHWLAGDMKLPYCLFSALARSEDGDELRDLARSGDLKPSNAVPFFDLEGNKTKGYEVVKVPADKVIELYDAHNQANRGEEKEDEKEEDDKDLFDPEGKLILPPYEHQESVDIPFKVSVTGIGGEGKPSDTTHVDLQIRGIDDFESANISMLTAANKGTILHRIMRFIDLEGLREGIISFEDEIKELIKSGYLNICTPADAMEVASEFEEGIMAFCKDGRCEDVIRSFEDESARSEKPIVFAVYINGNEGDSALVQGIIDLIYKTSEGYTILDYKTDRLSGKSPEERAKEARERHAFQLNSYAAACEEDGVNVAHKLLYLVRYGEFVEV